MDFALTARQVELQGKAKELAGEFATRAEQHDQEASSPVENYAALKEAGFYGLFVPEEFGGIGCGYTDYVVVAEELAQGCPSTAVSFNMHAVSIAIFFLAAQDVSPATKRKIANMVISAGKLFAAIISELGTIGLIPRTSACSTQARRVEGGLATNGRKQFGTMADAADIYYVAAHPEESSNPDEALFMLVPRDSPGVRVEPTWDVLGMRASRSDTVVFENCFVDCEHVLDEMAVPNFGEVLASLEAYSNISYTAVYLGVAAFWAVIENLKARRPRGSSESLAHHPYIRRRMALASAQLEAARWVLRYASLSADHDGQTQAVLDAFLRAKYVVGEAVTAVTRSALEMGAHAIYRGSVLERLFRDGALATIQHPPSEYCLWALSASELGLDSPAKSTF